MGDELLRLVAERIRPVIRRGDTFARLGADEFALIQSGVDDPQFAANLAERIVELMSVPFEVNGQAVNVGASVGMAFKDKGQDVTGEALMKNADLALLKSKQTGRGTFSFFEEEMDSELRSRKVIESILRNAIKDHRFELHYQPQVDLASGRIVSVEALLRLDDPSVGKIPPDQFIPVAEQSGLIAPITRWVLKTACTDAAGWEGLCVAVNISPSVLIHAELVDMVSATLKETGLAPERLELEITEEVLIGNTVQALEILDNLKALGVNIAMDDFGTGYSSLAYLRKFPFDKIKIDRSFVADIQHSDSAQAIVRAIVVMGNALGMRVNAEGVESPDEVRVLVREQCQEVQGFLFARPMPKDRLSELLREGQVEAMEHLHKPKAPRVAESQVA